MIRAPDISGRAGRAWKITIPPDGPPDWKATIAGYLLNVPGAHPFWSWWMLAVIHLRPMADVAKPPHKRYPEAEYEFLIVSIDPSGPAPDPDAPGDGYRLLTPIDIAEQFHGLDDEEAAKLAEVSASTIANGQASPDQDWRPWWRLAILNTVKHIALGGHPREIA